MVKFKHKGGHDDMRTFFIADLHFGHTSCLRFDSRPWATVDEMDEGLIKLWNYKVRKEDHVYVLGDFAYKNGKPASEYTRRLNGAIHLIRGNHDKRTDEYEQCFDEVADYKEMAVEARGERHQLVLSHYFIPFYNGARQGAFMLHGHTHKTEESSIEEGIKQDIRGCGLRCEAYNVGCMWQGYEPQTFEEILTRNISPDVV